MAHTNETRRRALEVVLKRREDWLSENGPCSVCGSSDNLEVDHIDPDSKVSHRIWSWSEARRIEELSKCQVLCSDCHKKKTTEYRKSKMRHGTVSMYRYGKCRCASCKEAKNVTKTKQRARRRARGLVAK